MDDEKPRQKSRMNRWSDDVKSNEHTKDGNPSKTKFDGLLNGQKQPDRTEALSQSGREGENLYRHCVDQIASGAITPHRVIEQLSAALNLGLSPEDTVTAHILLGNECIGLDDGTEATVHYDCALEFARKYREALDAELFSMFYRNISARYIALAKSIRCKEGVNDSFVYLEAKQGLLNGGASPAIYLELGNLYDEKDPFDFDKIAFYYTKATECPVLDEDDETAVLTAKEKLRIIEKERSHLMPGKHPRAIGMLPWTKSHRKLLLTTGLGVLVLAVGLTAVPHIRMNALHRPANQEALSLAENHEVLKASKPARVVVRSESPRTAKTMRKTFARRGPVQPTVRSHVRVQKESFALNDRWGWPDILP